MGKTLYDDLLSVYEVVMGPPAGLFRRRRRGAGG